jgi:hypothetical protein
MGALTLSDFQTEILAGLGNRTENSVSAQRIVNGLNLAQSRISRSYDFSEMAQVAFAQMNFTQNPAVDKFLVPPANVKTIHSFVLLDTSSGFSSLGQSKKVTERPWRLFDKRYPAPEWLPPSWPEDYARWGKFIVMAPPPFLQFTSQLRYTSFATPFALNALTQVSEFENKDDIIINYTLGYFFKTLGRTDRAAYFEALAKEQLDEAIDKDDTRPDIEVSRDTESSVSDNTGAYWQNPFIMRSP